MIRIYEVMVAITCTYEGYIYETPSSNIW